ncbi:MAG: hypothetical protein ABI597_01585 [Gammaproteobacteria bacterium]
MESRKTKLLEALHLKDGDVTATQLAKIAEVYCTLKFIKQQKANQELNQEEERAEAEEADALKAANEIKNQIRKILAECYKNGDAELGITRDFWKSKGYGDEELANLAATKKRMDLFYLSLAWFTSFRLFFLRLNRIFDYNNMAFIVDRTIEVGNTFFNTVFNAILNNAKTLFTILGLSYIVELLGDCSVIAKAAFFASQEEKENNPSAWSRAVNTFRKGERIPRMANALVWFTINLLGFYFTGGISAALNTGLFVFDVFVDVYKFYRDKSKHVCLANHIRKQKQELENDLEEPTTDHEFIKKQIAIKDQILTQIKQQQTTVTNKRLYGLIITSIVLISMLLIFFPPAAIPLSVVALKMIGGCMAFSCSIFGGLGKRIFEKVTAPKETPPKVIAADPDVPQADMVNIQGELQKNLLQKAGAGQEIAAFPEQQIKAPQRPQEPLLIRNESDSDLVAMNGSVSPASATGESSDISASESMSSSMVMDGSESPGLDDVSAAALPGYSIVAGGKPKPQNDEIQPLLEPEDSLNYGYN